MITVQYLRECFLYFPDTGVLVWKLRPLDHFNGRNSMNAWNGRYAGSVAGTIDGDGYIQCRLNYVGIKAHKICWAMAYGQLPNSQIDHIDRNRANNAISNLRKCTNAENSRNTIRENVTGFKGVRKSGRKFTAQISVSMKKLHLGSFDTAELAHAAYRAAATRHHGELANFGDQK